MLFRSQHSAGGHQPVRLARHHRKGTAKGCSDCQSGDNFTSLKTGLQRNGGKNYLPEESSVIDLSFEAHFDQADTASVICRCPRHQSEGDYKQPTGAFLSGIYQVYYAWLLHLHCLKGNPHYNYDIRAFGVILQGHIWC